MDSSSTVEDHRHRDVHPAMMSTKLVELEAQLSNNQATVMAGRTVQVGPGLTMLTFIQGLLALEAGIP